MNNKSKNRLARSTDTFPKTASGFFPEQENLFHILFVAPTTLQQQQQVQLQRNNSSNSWLRLQQN